MKKFLATGLVMLGTLLTGCAGTGIAVRYGPPPPRYGVIGVAPRAGYVWTDGYWDWRGGNYVWVNGRWMRPPRAHAVWVSGGWVQGRHGYEFRRGHWR